MDRVFQSNVSGTPPTAPAVPVIGYPQSGNPGTGQPATKPGPWWFHMVTEELRNILGAAGIVASAADTDQVLEALRVLFMARATNAWINDSAGANRLYFEAGGQTRLKGAGATPLAFVNSAGTTLMSLASDGRILGIADAVNSGEIPRLGQVQGLVNTRPAHTYGVNDWFWLDKAAGEMLQRGVVTSTADGVQTFTFATPFPVECTTIVTTRIEAGTLWPINPATVTRFGFTIDRYVDINGSTNIHFMALGR